MIRMRRVKAFPSWRRRYEVDLNGEVRRTGTPATLLDGEFGVGDARSLVHAADAAWEADQPGWISFPPQVKANQSDRPERRRVGPDEGGRLYYELLGIFLRHDPIGINFDENVDEYSPEVETVLPRLDEAQDVESLATLLHEEFHQWFSGGAGPRDRYLPIARDIWQRVQAGPTSDPVYDEILSVWLEMRDSWPPLEGALVDDQLWVSQVITAYLAGFRPLPEWAVEILDNFEAHVNASELTTKPQRDFIERLVTLGHRIRGAA